MPSKKLNTIILLIILLTLFLWYFLHKNSVEEDHHLKPQEQSAQIKNSQQNPFLMQFPTETSNPSAQNITKSKSKLIDELTATGNPKDALEAFKIAQDCINLKDFYKRNTLRDLNYDEQENNINAACEDITPSQIRGRVDSLKKAVDARVKGAVVEFARLGPIIDDYYAFEDRQSDPLVIEWKNKVNTLLKDTAIAGDTESLYLLTNYYQIGAMVDKDPVLALTYEVARQEIRSNDGTFLSENEKILNNNLFAKLSENMTPQQINLAITNGKQIAVNCCTKK